MCFFSDMDRTHIGCFFWRVKSIPSYARTKTPTTNRIIPSQLIGFIYHLFCHGQ